MDHEPPPARPRAEPRPWARTAFGAAGCATAFVVLAALVLAGAPFPRALDVSVHDRVRAYSLQHPGFLDAMATLTHLGDTVVVALAVTVLAAVALARGRRSQAVAIATTAVAAFVLSRTLRVALGRPRPADPLWEAADAAFPSGHATNSAALAGIVVILCWPLVGRVGRVAVLSCAGGYAALVGLTRLAGGVHWLSDVLGAWLLAAACVLTTAVIMRRA